MNGYIPHGIILRHGNSTVVSAGYSENGAKLGAMNVIGGIVAHPHSFARATTKQSLDFFRTIARDRDNAILDLLFYITDKHAHPPKDQSPTFRKGYKAALTEIIKRIVQTQL